MTDRTEHTEPPAFTEGIRPTWSRSGRPLARRIVQPLQAFLEAEISSATLLLVATAVALLWANAPGDSYERVWETELTMRLGSWSVTDDLGGWVSDGLMTIFFLVVGLEIKRELLTGELRDRRKAALPAIAALGGMLVPAAIYLAFTAGTDAAEGFAIAMPTDIVFALAVLTLARRAQTGTKALVLTLAIVDDLGSIVVVAIGYAGGIRWLPLAAAIVLLGAFAGFWRIGVRAVIVYVALGVGSWVALEAAGVSPTLAGVAVAILTPSVAFQRPRFVSEEAHRVADLTVDEPDPPDADAAQWLDLARLSREAVSPLARAEALLLPWSSFVVVPLFALANAGVRISGHAVAEAATSPIGLGILTSRIVGKPVGIVLASLVAVWLGVATLPTGMTRRHLVAIAVAAAIPFTVSLFVAQLALPVELVDPATAAILLAAVVAGSVGYLLLRRIDEAGERTDETARPGRSR